MLRFRYVFALGVVVASIFVSPRSCAENLEKLPASAVSLNDGWQIQSSCVAKSTGRQVSTPGFEATGWHKTTVPNTVVSTLVDDKTYPDPTYGTNLKKFPGMNYNGKSFFANQDMPEESPFKCSCGGERNSFRGRPSQAIIFGCTFPVSTTALTCG